MNVLMLNPPYYLKYSRSQRSPAVIKSGVMYYPIWLAYATGVLEQAGFNVKLVDAPAEGYSLTYVLDYIKEFQPRLIVVDTSTPSIHNDINVARAIKSILPEVYILFVGPHVTSLPEETLGMDLSIDAIARGEYDYSVLDVAQYLEGGGDESKILGLSYRNGKSGDIIHNADRPFIKNLDALPFVSQVYKRHLRIENYFYSITQYPEVAIISGRGCPYHCTYCIWPQTLTGHGYRRRSVENVADEFDYIARELPQVKEIFIEDDTLTVNQKRSIALAEKLMERGNILPFTANSRADVEYKTLYWLKKAGLRLLCVGFESGDQEILNAIKKKITIDQFFKFREAARQAKVLVHGCFMAGNPGETNESLKKTLKLAKELNPDTAQIFPLMVYPGSEAYDWVKQNGYLTTEDFGEWLTPDGLHKSVVSYPNLTSEELVNWCDYARRSFYLRPRFVIKKLWEILIHPKEAGRIIKAGRTFVKYLFRSSIYQSSRVRNIRSEVK
jgi:anaerobic magnesium-protoporphyrin IX monomethyl ester cyclase